VLWIRVLNTTLTYENVSTKIELVLQSDMGKKFSRCIRQDTVGTAYE